MVMSYVSLHDLSQVQCPCKQMKQYYTIKKRNKDYYNVIIVCHSFLKVARISAAEFILYA